MENIINVYEVLKIINSKPLFIKEHYNRYKNSIIPLNVNVVSEDTFLKEICKTIKSNHIIYGNIRIDFFIYPENNEFSISVKKIPHRYPNPEQYKYGVKTCLFPYERKNPNQKIWNGNLREEVDNIINNSEYYEVIYYNSDNIITEGSRSNIFFIKSEKLMTPKINMVLPGVTRQKVIEIAKRKNLNFQEIDISVDQLSNIDAAFLSGTSLDILPLKSIDDFEFNIDNNIMRNLMSDLRQIIKTDLDNIKPCVKSF